MTGSSWWQHVWVWYGSGLALGTLALILLIWALLWDRSRGRARCPKCWYDMSGAVPPPQAPQTWTCPECGRTGTGERPLRRTRRRRVWACIALILLTGAWLAAEQPAIQRRGWMWLIPTRILIEALPLQNTDGPFRAELNRRLGRAIWPDGAIQATMSESQLATLFERCAEGNWLARPVDDRWRNSYGALAKTDLIQVWYQRTMSKGEPQIPTAAGAAADRITAAVKVLRLLHGPLTARTRNKWPRGLPLHVELPVETWWDAHGTCMHVEWKNEASGQTGDSWCTGHTELKVPGDGHVRLSVTLTYVDGDDAPWNPKNRVVVSSNSGTIEYDVVDSIDDIMHPVESKAIDAQLASTLMAKRDSMIDWNGIRALQGLHPASTSFGFRIEYLLDNKVIVLSHCRFTGGTNGPACEGTTSSPGAKTWAEAMTLLRDPNIIVRIATDPEWALSNIDAKDYWKGDTTITVEKVK